MISVFLMLNTEKVNFSFFEKVILKDVQILFFSTWILQKACVVCGGKVMGEK